MSISGLTLTGGTETQGGAILNQGTLSLTNDVFSGNIATDIDCDECGKPMIISTGMASDAEIDDALATVRANGNPPCVLLHCVSGYPTPASEINLRRIPYLAQRFGVTIGLSDHTLGTAVPVAATAIGKPHSLFETKMGALYWSARHEMLHAGQIGLLKRLVGIPAAW